MGGKNASSLVKVDLREAVDLRLPTEPPKKKGSRPRVSVRATLGRSRYHLMVDLNGIPLAVHLSAANGHDATRLLPWVVERTLARLLRCRWLRVRYEQEAQLLHRLHLSSALISWGSLAPRMAKGVRERATPGGIIPIALESLAKLP